MNWYYIDGPRRVGPIDEPEWSAMIREGKIRPETLVWHEGMDARWVPFSELHTEPREVEADAEILEAGDLPLEDESPEAFVERVTPLDFPVRISDCVSRGWSAFIERFGLLVGTTFLAVAIFGASAVVPGVNLLVSLFLHGVIMGGLMLVCLRAIRGEPAEIADLFAGFRPPVFMQLLLQTVVSSAVWQLCFAPALIAMFMLGISPTAVYEAAQNGTVESLITDPQTALVLLLVFMTCSIPAVYFVYCWMFSIPLIIDRGLPFWPAMQLSRRKVLQHPWKIGMLSLVAGIVASAGIVLALVGVLLTAPLYTIIMLVLYEDMFQDESPTSGQPKE